MKKSCIKSFGGNKILRLLLCFALFAVASIKMMTVQYDFRNSLPPGFPKFLHTWKTAWEMEKQTNSTEVSGSEDLSSWPEPCVTTARKHKAAPRVEDIVEVAMRHIAASSMFVTARDVRRRGWRGPGHFAKRREAGAVKELLPRSNGSVLGLWPSRDRCAVVGNSGHLKLTSYGKAIDAHDFVLRLNQGPTHGYEKWVGRRTSARLINHSWLHNYASALHDAAREARPNSRRLLELDAGHAARVKDKAWARFHQASVSAHRWSAQMRGFPRGQQLPLLTAKGSSVVWQGLEAPLEKNAAVIFRWQTGTTARGTASMIRTIQAARPDVQVVILSSDFRNTTRAVMRVFNKRLKCIKINPEGGDIPSSGLMAVLVAMALCRSVDLYGFGASASGGRRVPFHYFTNLGERSWTSKADIHSFNSEQLLIERLAAAGYVTMCNDRPSRRCSAVGSAEG